MFEECLCRVLQTNFAQMRENNNMKYLTRTEFEDVFPEFSRLAVGFDPLFRTFETLSQTGSNSPNGFPPYDLEKTGENTFRLTLAVAGYDRKDLNITIANNVLTVEAVSKQKEGNYLYKGIAARSFKRSFALDNWVHVTAADLTNGMLTIDLVQELPEQMKTRKIEISSNNLLEGRIL